MKIAQIVSIIERVPPRKYGGIERVVYALTEGLVRRGHEVTLFASGNSETSAKLVSVYPKSLKEAKLTDPYGSNILSMTHIGFAYEKAKNFDIIHDHIGSESLPTANICKTPSVFTTHGPFTPEIKRIYNTLRHPYVVTISKSQAEKAPDLNHIGTVYNGLEMDDYPFSKTDDGYLLFVGRISAEKGVHLAIEAAQYLDLPLIIAAKLETNFQPDILYFKQYIEPKLSDQIRWIGEVDDNEKTQLMSKAKALLNPINWNEPFGLVMIEAMSCGCPVVAFNKGSIPEIVQNGKSGFVVEDLEGMINAVANINLIDREYCREYSLANFNAEQMVDDYLKVYQKVLNLSTKRPLKTNLNHKDPLVI